MVRWGILLCFFPFIAFAQSIPTPSVIALQDVSAYNDPAHHQGDTDQYSAWSTAAACAGNFSGGCVFGQLNDGGWTPKCNGSNICLTQLVSYDPSNVAGTVVNGVNRLFSFGGQSQASCVGGNTYQWKSRHPFFANGNLYLPVYCMDNGPPFRSHQSGLVMSPDAGAHWCNYKTYTANGNTCASPFWKDDGDAPMGNDALQWSTLTDATSKIGRMDIIDMFCQDNTVHCPTIAGIDNSTYLYFVGSQGVTKNMFIFRTLKKDPMLPANWSAYNAGTWDSTIQNATTVGNSGLRGAPCCSAYSWLPDAKVFAMWQHNGGAVNTSMGFATAPTIFGPWTQQADIPGMGANSQFPSPIAPLYRVVKGRVVLTIANNTSTSTDNLQFIDLDLGIQSVQEDSIVAQNQGPLSVGAAAPLTVTLQATDLDGFPLTFHIVTLPSQGRLSPVAGDQVIYTPNAGYSGSDQFTFKASHETLDSNTATVLLSVTSAPPPSPLPPAPPPPAASEINTNLDKVKVYPTPWRKDKHEGKKITFSNLPTGSRVKLFTLNGRQVQDLTEADGSVLWDMTNNAGQAVSSGVYLYVVTDPHGHKMHGKVVVIK